MEPHRSYLAALRPHLGRVKGLAHITGGGLLDNVPRVLPAIGGGALRREQLAARPRSSG